VRWGFPRMRGQSRETVKCRNFFPNQALYQAEPQPEMEYLLWGTRPMRHLLRVF
jgi:hypothetical protein